MSWRVARSLEVLRDQINAAFPRRNKASDGTIGDAAHATSVSDHNPDSVGVVRALDITHDPASGCDIDRLTDELVASRDLRISYLIANGLITGPNYGWVWARYDGDDPHTNHLHLSVVADGRADDPHPWSIGAATPGEDGAVISLIRWQGSPHVFLTDGLTARWVRTDAEMRDLATLAAEERISLAGGATPRVVARRELVGRIVGQVPEGWGDYAAAPASTTMAMTDAQVAAIAAEAARVLGSRVEDLEQRIDRVVDAVVAAGRVAGGVA